MVWVGSPGVTVLVDFKFLGSHRPVSRAGEPPRPRVRRGGSGGHRTAGQRFQEAYEWGWSDGRWDWEVLQAEGMAPAEAWDGDNWGYFDPV